jgi:hypothetical protein
LTAFELRSSKLVDVAFSPVSGKKLGPESVPVLIARTG